MSDYNAADNGAKSYALAIDTMREKLESFHRVQIGDCTLYNADCREVLPLLPKVDAVVTDPPYGIGFEYASYDDTRENLQNLIDNVIPKCRSVANRCIIMCGPTQIGLYPQADWVGAVVWNTTGSFGKYGFNQWTPLVFYGPDVKGFGSVNGMTKTDVISINGGGSVGFQRAKEETLHTCPKPFGMMKTVITRYTEPDTTILDPFMGSGTTGVACVKLGRKFIGIEIEPKYFEIACRRIQAAYDQPDMFVEQPQAKAEQLDMLEEAAE